MVKRAKPFEMNVIGHDPYVSPQTARDMGVELVSLDELYEQSDYLTLHVANTPETERMLNAAAFAKMKTGVRIVNCARGELVNEADLQTAMGTAKWRARRSMFF